MRITLTRAARLAAPVAVLLATALAVAAQSFVPVARVNDGVVTAWELQQRQRMLALLNASPEAQAEALDALIGERIQQQAAAAMGINVSDAAVEAGIDEFAARGNLSGEEFLALIGREGIDPETMRDFIRTGLAWRDTVRARFEPVVQISPEDVAREIETVRVESGPRVLLAEIILQARNEIERVEADEIAERIGQMRSFDAFSTAAREYSTADSAQNGGRVEWIPLSNLEGPVANALQGLSVGQVSAPVAIPSGIALFQLRGFEESARRGSAELMDYAIFLIPGGRTEAALAEAARIDARVDTCNDLYGVARGLPADRLIREVRPVGQIPQDINAQLAGLDMNEVSTALTRGGALVFLMLCERNVAGEIAIEETAITARLRSEELARRARIWFAELKSEAYIRIGE